MQAHGTQSSKIKKLPLLGATPECRVVAHARRHIYLHLAVCINKIKLAVQSGFMWTNINNSHATYSQSHASATHKYLTFDE